MINRADLITSHFGFLVNEFAFRLDKKDFDYQTMGNAVAIYKSSKYGIEIVIDKNQVLISVGELPDSRMQWFEFRDVMKYYAPEVENIYVFPEKTDNTTWDDVVEMQLSRLANMMRQYCGSLLSAEPWVRKELKKIESQRALEMYKEFNQGPHN